MADDLVIEPSLVGSKVRVLARPDWGAGTVVSLSRATGVHRVTIDFPVVGRRVVVVPPARLGPPEAGPVRQAGWLDSLAGATADQRLRQLPADVEQVLGTPAQRLAAVLPWYGFDAEEHGLVRWARALVRASDPLSVWSRDELEAAFAAFCRERDAHLRGVAALLRQQEGAQGLAAWIDQLEQPIRERVREALRRPL
ncbi:MAG: DUF3553 domain-containing protein [Phycisphaerae bacterium]|jgi:hypothetical protein|nr:DUF3553 domain-containing protein [Phycisphaerae bacterium]MCZ2399409.1 DUF3553 domain-containing protein [Phycisphaerae bacterium]NUQ50757.1 DUF3553 domain-containing protein [Phycisphaerae bacterium]